MASLNDIAGIQDQRERTERYRLHLDSIFASIDPREPAISFIDHVLSDSVPLVISRQILLVLANEIFAKLKPEFSKPVAFHALDKLQPRLVSFEEQVIILRESLSALLEKEEEFSKAAHVLSGIDLDSSMRANSDPSWKLRLCIKVAMLYLEDDDPVNAETHIKKASLLISTCKAQDLELQYKTCYARILDSKRKFLEAATRYYELSLIGATGRKDAMVDENELMMSLSLALSCTVLAPAGTQRSRMLSTLFKDERCPGLPMYPLLEKVFKERILGREEVEAFSKTLSPHQLAILPDGSTVLDRSVMQHNLSALSKLYCNISFEELGAILGVSSDKAESIASDMIMEGRLVANVDQIDGFISFQQEEGLVQWDKRIQEICVKVNSIVEDMQKSVQDIV